ncbi:uncharacterized protein ASCRUDRAFT_17276, partial [Ascoidea rubescens DSM 1968]
IEGLKNKQISNERKTEERLRKLAEDLYVQYSKKHEQKVGILKKGYETKWQSKLNSAHTVNENLKREIQGIREELKTERKEKGELIKLWDK